MSPIVVVGASAAGSSAVDELVSLGYEGRVVLVGAEQHPPYSRPALSKQFLAGDLTSEAVALPGLPDGVEFWPGATATALDLERRTVTVHNDAGRSAEILRYGGLVLATGCHPRRILPPAFGALTVRTIDDATRLGRALRVGTHLVVVGAGFLGLELATSALRRGATVDVVDREPPLKRLLGPEMSALVSRRLTQAGANFIHEPAGVPAEQDHSLGLRLCSGRRLGADLVVEAVGDRPATDWLRGSGIPLHTDGSVITAASGRVRERVVAAGDVRASVGPHGLTRTPYWSAAIADGRRAACTLLGLPDAVAPPGYFWTEVFGLSVRVFGSLPVHGSLRVIDGDLDRDTAVVGWRSPTGQAVAVAAINHPISSRQLRRALGEPAIAPTEPTEETTHV
ncbi:NAD(P)/FAD-dependent oxidoreductase [Saccharopolyspora phatthalungensis]|uniref:NADPH-dependent 2,4-dienoyl-CoA reductase/sulfur reductase-like enzyme n=1 Tax=Saccharopolyspora phatthalungensis TaxID=664693 RepID=A0A840QHI5_9PSEU|nr:FAD-dependent oxidoreductase [Saccharopolyspora phatthalungensis]MBB5159460.1 NADPH-dependent 2,4-dienoyl-CoA reductase/sulfur reductase-like enzyme [Saccharopolyspora phatthalungensis]